MVHARDLKFHICIPHEKIVDPYLYQDENIILDKAKDLKNRIKQNYFFWNCICSYEASALLCSRYRA